MDTRDDLPPAGWYPDPTGTQAARYWDGARWSGHVTPAPLTPARKSSWNLSVVFGLEVAFVLASFLLAWVLLLGVANCGASAACDDLWRAWLLLMVAHPALLVVSVALFVAGARAKRDAVKRWAVGVLGIGIGRPGCRSS